jgi:hypothetical protein
MYLLPTAWRWSNHIHRNMYQPFKLANANHDGTRGSSVVDALRYNPEGRWFGSRWGEWHLSIYLIIAAAWALGFTQHLTEMTTREKNKKCYWVIERGRYVRRTFSPLSLSQLSRQCGTISTS